MKRIRLVSGTIFAVILAVVLSLGVVPAAAQNITTAAGTGVGGYNGDNIPATSAQLFAPYGVAVDSAGNLYIADSGNSRIRKVDTRGTITTVAGTGTAGYNGDNIPATSAEITSPYGVAVDSAGNIYFPDSNNNRVRKVDTSGIITTVAGMGVAGYNGDNIPATSAELSVPYGVGVDSAGNLYIADEGNHRIRKVDASGTITTVAGTGTGGYNGDNIPATSADLYYPFGVAADSKGNLFIADYFNERVRKVDAGGTITTVAGTGTSGYNGDNIAAASAQLNRPWGVAVDGVGNFYIADQTNQRIRKVDATGTITTVAGNGNFCEYTPSCYNGDNIPAINAQLYNPTGVAVDSAGNIYIGDQQNSRVREVTTPATPTITTLMSSLNPATAGDSVTFTATVTSSSGTPTGTVTFFNGQTVLSQVAVGSSVFLGGGQPPPARAGSGAPTTLTIEDADTLGAGNFTISAQYTPDTSAFSRSGATIQQTVTLPGIALTNGNNTLTGNQAVNGTVNATSFTGDGSGLTNVTAAHANSADTATTANFATSAGTANTATNALSLGGILATNFARLDIGNSLTGTQSIAGDLITTGNFSGGSGNFSGNVGIGTATPLGKLQIGSQVSLDEPVPGQTSLTKNLVYLSQQWQYMQNGKGAAIELGNDNVGESAGGIEFYTAPAGSAGGVATLTPSTSRMVIRNDGTIYMVQNGGNVGIGTSSPRATLEVNGTTMFDNPVTFATGQTFPGAGTGTITGVTAGSGLAGGGTAGNVSLSIPAAGVTDAMLANPSLSVNAGAGLTGGGSVPLGGTTTLSLATATCSAGSAVTNLPLACTPFPTFGANTFTGNQTMPSLVVSGQINSGSISSGAGVFSASAVAAVAGVSNSSYGVAGNSTSGVGVGGASSSGYGVAGNSTSSVGVGGASSSGFGVWASSNSGVGILGTTASTAVTVAAGVLNNNAAGNAGNILLGQSAGVTKFTVDSKGDVAASGSVTIGSGGTPITTHGSWTTSVSLAKLTSPNCTPPIPFTPPQGVPAPADEDTVAVGMSNAFMAGGNVVYSAWAETTGTGTGVVNIRFCNIAGSPISGPAYIRIDVWKH